jgi:ferredoxin
MKIVVNWGLCDGNGNCAKEAPELFALDANDSLHVLKEDFGAEYRAKAEAAVRSCPKSALSLAEEMHPDNEGIRG